MKHELPILPTTGVLLFPSVARSLALDDPSMIAAVRAAHAAPGRRLVTVAARARGDDGTTEALSDVGTYAVLSRLVARKKGVEVIVQGLERAAIERTRAHREYRAATIRTMPLPAPGRRAQVAALERRVVELAARLLAVRSEATLDLRDLSERLTGTTRIYVIAAVLGLGVEKEQALLEAQTSEEALERLLAHLAFELEVRERKDAELIAGVKGPRRAKRRAGRA
ncbi:LON peptidase substrate-binding domain-containing protein [Myxococcota bacterium]|nr:LON peptidase substrate-binding domain-containing protein [Myxococcota bacterium]